MRHLYVWAAALALHVAGYEPTAASDWLWLAFFIVPAIVGAIGLTGIAATIATTVISVGLAVGASFLVNKFLTKKPSDTPADAMVDTAGGVELNLRADADIPQAIIIGTAVTAGSLVYTNTYGKNGDVENSNLIQIISLADHRCAGLRATFLEGNMAVLKDTGTDRGFVVEGYTGAVDNETTAAWESAISSATGIVRGATEIAYATLVAEGKIQTNGDLLALRFFDGTQTAADSFTVSKLGGATEPWTAAHIGTGTTYVRLHSIYEREKVPGTMRWRFVLDGWLMYDPRKDDTVVGGEGPHRWDDESTREFSDNIAVLTYNICRGLYQDGEFIYGLEDTKPEQLPPDIWFAAMNECDLLVEKADGTFEKQFVGGAEISVDTEPMETIRTLMRACGGRFVEVGGTYKLYVGAPAAPIMSFDDGAIIVDESENFQPVKGLEERVNYVTGKYTAAEDGWVPKIAPPRGNAEWEAEDGRRLPADLDAPIVQSPTQFQRLQLQILQRARRERTHGFTLPPEAFVIEPGDVVEWTSPRNGYVAKLLEVLSVEYHPDLNITIRVVEVDPSDYDWETEYEVPDPDGYIVTTRPPPKVIGGFAIAPYVDHGATTKRPGIKLTWDDPEDGDAVGIAYELRMLAAPTNVVPYSTTEEGVVESGALIIVGGIQPNTQYQIRARFLSDNGFATDWSLWLTVTSPDIRFTYNDLADELQAMLGEAEEAIRDENARAIQYLADMLAELAANAMEDKRQVITDIVSRTGRAIAQVQNEIRVATGPDSALAQQIQSVSAQVDQVEANLKITWVAAATPAGALAQYDAYATAQAANAGISIRAFDDGAGGAYGSVYVTADRFWITNGGASQRQVFIIDGSNIFLNGTVIAPGTVKVNMLDVSTLSAITANIGNVTAGVLQSPDGKMVINLSGGFIDIFD